MNQQFKKEIKDVQDSIRGMTDQGAHGPLKEALSLMMKEIEDYNVCAECGSRNVFHKEDEDLYICNNCDFEWRVGEV